MPVVGHVAAPTDEQIKALFEGYYSATNQLKWMQVEDSKDAVCFSIDVKCAPLVLFQWYQCSTGGGKWVKVEIELK